MALHAQLTQQTLSEGLNLITRAWGRAEILLTSGHKTCKLTDTEIYKYIFQEKPCRLACVKERPPPPPPPTPPPAQHSPHTVGRYCVARLETALCRPGTTKIAPHNLGLIPLAREPRADHESPSPADPSPGLADRQLALPPPLPPNKVKRTDS